MYEAGEGSKEVDFRTFVRVSRPSITAIRLKERSSHVKFTRWSIPSILVIPLLSRRSSTWTGVRANSLQKINRRSNSRARTSPTSDCKFSIRGTPTNESRSFSSFDRAIALSTALSVQIDERNTRCPRRNGNDREANPWGVGPSASLSLPASTFPRLQHTLR